MARKRLILTMIVVMIFTLSACTTAEPIRPEVEVGAEEVIFLDPNLENAIRITIAKSEGPIYDSDLRRITTLRAADSGITDLTGLECCTRLENLWLYRNELTDISQLAHLTKLITLDLSYNQISDVSALASLTELTSLNLAENEISDLSPLASLSANLTVLHLDHNNITDISPLASLTKLSMLWLNNNQISDISVLAGLQGPRELRIHQNNITDISPLLEISGWTTGSRIYLGHNPLSEKSLNEVFPVLEEKVMHIGR